MQITITIADKIVKTAIENALDCNLYDYFDTATVRAAKLPKMATVVKDIFNDAKFQKDLAKRLAETAEAAVEECIFDDLTYEVELPLLTELIEQCEAVTAEAEQAAEAEREAEEVKRMVKALERAGFKISKV